MSELLDYMKDAAGTLSSAYLRLRASALSFAESVGAGRAAELAAAAPDMLCTIASLLRDGRVPRRAKLKLGLAAAYIAMPIDGLPGSLDDIYVGLAALASVMDDIGAEALCEYWPGNVQELLRFKALMIRLNDRFGTGAVRRLAGRLGISVEIEVSAR